LVAKNEVPDKIPPFKAAPDLGLDYLQQCSYATPYLCNSGGEGVNGIFF